MDARIAAAATPGFRLVTRTRLRERGVGYKSVSRRVAEGRLTPVTHEVLALGRTVGRPTFELLNMAAVLEAGDDAALFGTTALVQLGAWEPRRHDGSIHVVAPRIVRPIPKWDMSFHRCSDPIPHSIVLAERVPTCAAANACLQAANQQTAHQLAHAVRRATYLELMTIDDFAHRVDASSRRRGIVVARRAVELLREHSAGTKSNSEDRALPFLVAAFGEPLVNVMGAAGIPDYEPDFLWRRERIIVEIDGRPHQLDPVTIERDRIRHELLRAAGWIVIRIPYRRVWNQMSKVLAELRTQFASRD